MALTVVKKKKSDVDFWNRYGAEISALADELIERIEAEDRKEENDKVMKDLMSQKAERLEDEAQFISMVQELTMDMYICKLLRQDLQRKYGATKEDIDTLFDIGNMEARTFIKEIERKMYEKNNL